MKDIWFSKRINDFSVVKKIRSAIIANKLLTEEKSVTELNVCVPKSLEKWKRRHGKKEARSILPGLKKCIKAKLLESKLTGIKPYQKNSKKDKVLSRKYWDDLDKKLKKDKLLSHFPKVVLMSLKLENIIQFPGEKTIWF